MVSHLFLVVFQKWRWPCLRCPSKGIAVDKQANDNVMHLNRLGKTNGFTRETLDARPQCQMLAFNLLRSAFPGDMSFGSQMPCIRPPVIGEEAGEAKGLQ